MFGPPPEIDPNRRPKNIVGDGPLGPKHIVFAAVLIAFVVLISRQILHPPDESAGKVSAPAEPAKPQPRKPATILDDDVSVLIVYPSDSWGRTAELISEMALAKSEWQKQNPHKHIVACDHAGVKPDEYGYCWIIHYEKK